MRGNNLRRNPAYPLLIFVFALIITVGTGIMPGLMPAASAETAQVSYIDENGQAKTATAIVLTGDEDKDFYERRMRVILGDGTNTWYVANNNITYTSGDDTAFTTMLFLRGNVHLIIADGATVTVQDRIDYNSYEGNSTLSVYGQAKGTGKLVSGAFNAYEVNICSAVYETGLINNANVNVKGGKLTVNGDVTCANLTITGGVTNITGKADASTLLSLGCGSMNDRITIGTYDPGYGAVFQVAEGQTLTDGKDNYSGVLKQSENVENDNVSNLAGKTLMLAHDHAPADMTLTPSVAPTYNPQSKTYTDGKCAYYTCPLCGGIFVMEGGEPIAKTENELILPYFSFWSVTIAGQLICELHAYNGTDASVAIPDTVPANYIDAAQAGNTITAIDSHAFENKAFVTDVTIGNGVYAIYENAFAGCTSLARFTVGSGLSYIAARAFKGCTSLESFTSSSMQEINASFKSDITEGSFDANSNIQFRGPHGSTLQQMAYEFGGTFSPTDKHSAPVWSWEEDWTGAAVTFSCGESCDIGSEPLDADEITYARNKDSGIYTATAALTVDGYTYTDTVNTDLSEIVVQTPPSASAVTYGQALKDSVLTGGTAMLGNIEVAGSFAWADDTVKPAVSDSGTTEYPVTFLPDDAASYGTAEAKITLKVNKAAPDVTAPEAKTGLTYTGSAQKLVTAGKATGGEMLYAPGTDAAKAPAADLFAASIPTGTDVGTYYVWYQVAGDENHTDTDPLCITAAIGKNSDQIAAEAVEEKINALPAKDKVTLDDGEAIGEARKAYDALTKDQKKLISDETLKKLTDAEEAYKAAKEAADKEAAEKEEAEKKAAEKKAADEAAAKKVQDLIDALPEKDKVTLDDGEAIGEARKAYDALTDDQKKLISDETLKKLTDAEEAYKAAKEAADKEAAAKKVQDLIDALPEKDKVTLDDKDDIEAARKAYDALTDDQKKLISDETLKKLTDAEEALADLQKAAQWWPVIILPAKPSAPEAPAAEPTDVTVGELRYKLDPKTMTATVKGAKKKSVKTILIPGSIKVNGKKYTVTAIRAKAFRGMEKLAQVTIGKNVATIGTKAFYKCGKLKKLKIKTKHLTEETVGVSAFGMTDKNMIITCPKGMKELYEIILTGAGLSSKATVK